MFGRSLVDTVTYERRWGPHKVPILVQKCVQFIREHGLSEEGIFRLPGQDNTVRHFREAFDAGERPSFPRSTEMQSDSIWPQLTKLFYSHTGHSHRYPWWIISLLSN